MPTLRIHESLDDIDAVAWDALAGDRNPFVSHAFLAGLERCGCLREEYGWRPHHLALYRDGRLSAAAPVYVKGNSHGEYVFDWSWAHAWERAGGDYYPKLLCAIPYSPVTGPRLLTGNDPEPRESRHLLSDALVELTRRHGLSSAHVNFARTGDLDAFGENWLQRFDWQFHWHNQGWTDFEAFLAALTRKKRKNIRQERRHVADAGLACEMLAGGDIDAGTWAELHALYVGTFEEKGNLPALTLEFFQHLGRVMPGQILAAVARRSERIIAAALFLRGSDTLYGRYWGAREEIPGLHFELCYYQGIDYCLREGLARFEPGAQGEHKLARGFLPVPTHSRHFIADPGLREAIERALGDERASRRRYREILMAHSPYKTDTSA